MTPDGRRAVSASEDRTLRLWDLESGQTIRTLEGHTERVLAVAVTPDGRRAVSASEDRTLRLWDLESGQTISHARRPYGLGQRRGGDARRPPCRLGFGGPNAAALGPGERPNDPHARRPYGLRSVPWR